MSLALVVVLAVYAVAAPALFYGLWRLTLPAHRRRVPVPGSLIDMYNVSVTSDSDYVGLI